MTSPLSSLKKGRRTALPGTVPQRAEYDTGISMCNEDDRKLLEDVMADMKVSSRSSNESHTSDLLQTYTGKAASRLATISERHDPLRQAPTDQELMMMMTKKITALESQNRSQAKLIDDKDKNIRRLEYKLSILRKAQGTDTDKLQVLENRCLQLQQQVFEMEEFLSDYGMIWVGNKSNSPHNSDDDDDYLNDDDKQLENSETDSQTAANDSTSKKLRKRKSGLVNGNQFWNPTESEVKSLSIDFDLIIDNVKQMNVLAGEGVSRVQHTTDGARLRIPDPVDLALYSNGLMMFRGPFRSYEDQSTQRLIQDLTDGYFPSELQTRYPEGVPFKVTDRRDVTYTDRLTQIFQGEGRVLGAASEPGIAQATVSVKEGLQLGEEDVERFLRKLPRSVVKDGKVIDVREPLRQRLKGADVANRSEDVIVVDTPAVRELRERISSADQGPGSRPRSARGLATLRIKSETGEQTYLLKMNFNDTIGQVKQYLDRTRSTGAGQYLIKSTFPPRVLDNDTETLQQCGLTPSATLHLLRRNK